MSERGPKYEHVAIGSVVTAVVGTCAFCAWWINRDTKIDSGITPTPGDGRAAEVSPTPLPQGSRRMPGKEFTPTSTPEPTLDNVKVEQNSFCQTINNPQFPEGYNRGLPIVRNAFRAVMAAGDPYVVEAGPYGFTPGPIGQAVRNSLGLNSDPHLVPDLGGFDPTIDPGNIVHNGDIICIIQPQTFRINPENPGSGPTIHPDRG